MKRSFLSRRLFRRIPIRLSRRQSRFARTRSSARSRSARSHKHPRYHQSSSRRLTRRSRPSRFLKKRGGAIGETVATVEGIPVGKNVVVTNAKGVTRSLEDYKSMLNADTAREFSDDI